jgi:hypothetical protein
MPVFHEPVVCSHAVIHGVALDLNGVQKRYRRKRRGWISPELVPDVEKSIERIRGLGPEGVFVVYYDAWRSSRDIHVRKIVPAWKEVHLVP